jgi:NAD(P)-dependent dehydrogenase (short-subunit alcohol dehydrogenase family)
MQGSELRFDNRVAVITGGGRGLGRAQGLLLASRGAKVVLNDTGGSIKGHGVDLSPVDQVVKEIKAAGGDAVACTETVGTPEGGEAIVQAALDTYGRVDILIHCAGNHRPAPLAELPPADFDAVLDVHLRGGFHVVRAAFPHMCKAAYGRIVLTSSSAALYGQTTGANYSAAKAGLIGLSNVVALEGVASGVKCNLVFPGAITRMSEEFDTSNFPPTMTPEFVAPLVGWLAHESCSITAEMLIAMAGRYARVFFAESPGAYRADWTIEQVGKQIDSIRAADTPVVFPVVPAGQWAHVDYSFDMARKGSLQKSTP